MLLLIFVATQHVEGESHALTDNALNKYVSNCPDLFSFFFLLNLLFGQYCHAYYTQLMVSVVCSELNTAKTIVVTS